MRHQVVFLVAKNTKVPISEDLWDSHVMAKRKATLKDLQKQVIAFSESRDWKQFHNAKDLALSLSLEAAEVLEHFQWKATKKEIDAYSKKHKEEIGEELADVLYWLLTMSHELDIDLSEALEKKMIKNAQKYPVEKFKGRSEKYNQL